MFYSNDARYVSLDQYYHLLKKANFMRPQTEHHNQSTKVLLTLPRTHSKQISSIIGHTIIFIIQNVGMCVIISA